MPFGFRRSKKFGPFNFSVSKTGVSSSIKIGPVRLTRNARGKIVTTTSTGVRGLNHRKQW